MMQKTKKNKLYKIQPVIDYVRNTCRTIKPEIENLIDEQIIPANIVVLGSITQRNQLNGASKILFVQDHRV